MIALNQDMWWAFCEGLLLTCRMSLRRVGRGQEGRSWGWNSSVVWDFSGPVLVGWCPNHTHCPTRKEAGDGLTRGLATTSMGTGMTLDFANFCEVAPAHGDWGNKRLRCFRRCIASGTAQPPWVPGRGSLSPAWAWISSVGEGPVQGCSPGLSQDRERGSRSSSFNPICQWQPPTPIPGRFLFFTLPIERMQVRCWQHNQVSL